MSSLRFLTGASLLLSLLAPISAHAHSSAHARSAHGHAAHGHAAHAPAVHAQTDSTATLRGHVRLADGVGVDEVLLRLTCDDGTVAESRTLPGGAYSMPRLVPGAYTLEVRRLGFESRTLPVVVTAERTTRVDVTVVPLAVPLPSGVDATTFTGVVGVVGTYEDMMPLDSVSLRPLGEDTTIVSDASGRFVLPRTAGATGVFRVERPGYIPRLVSYTLKSGSTTELAILLDSGAMPKSDAGVWRDVIQRHNWSTPRAVRVARSELLATGAHNLLVALEQSPAVQESHLIFSRGACLFVNGQPRPGFPLDAILTDRVEYVEGYAMRGDLSRTLATRWPANSTCGVPGGELTVRRAIESGQGVQFVVVWLR